MTYYPDHSPYSYFPDSVPVGVVALNVGWLEPEHQYTEGGLQEEFIEAFGDLCRHHRRAASRGYHICRLGHPERKEERRPDGKLMIPGMEKVSIAGDIVGLGSAEVRVVSCDGTWLIAPDLVYHYVAEHRYLPPPEFIEAVTARRVARP